MACYGWHAAMVPVGIVAWGVLATTPLRAQTAEVTEQTLASTGQALASPQSTTPCFSPSDYAPGSAMKQLVRMAPCELEQLYARGTLAPIPAGKIRGQALLNPGTRLAVSTSSASRLIWQGKIFHPDGRTAVNRFFGVRVIKADVYSDGSWRDGRPALVLDYSRTSRLYAPYRDEIRQIAPGLFLGLMFDRNTCPPKLKMYFALECVP